MLYTKLLTSSFLGPKSFWSTLFSNTCNFCSSLKNDYISQPYKQMEK
jgi:hypothetical protein